MGWLFGYPDRRSLIEELTGERPWWRHSDGSDRRLVTLARYASGNDVWAVQQYHKRHGSQDWEPCDAPFVCLYMLRRNGDWGYKPVTGDMGPYTYTCPPAFLVMAPQWDNEYWSNWACKVLEHANVSPNEYLARRLLYRLAGVKPGRRIRPREEKTEQTA